MIWVARIRVVVLIVKVMLIAQVEGVWLGHSWLQADCEGHLLIPLFLYYRGIVGMVNFWVLYEREHRLSNIVTGSASTRLNGYHSMSAQRQHHGIILHIPPSSPNFAKTLNPAVEPSPREQCCILPSVSRVRRKTWPPFEIPHQPPLVHDP